MINLKPSIEKIESLLEDNTESSVTYAALECRLAIERICYERLRVAHDYISHDDLKKWQPSDIVKTLIQEVDAQAAETFTLSIAKEPRPEGSSPPTKADYDAMEWLPVGTQVGFSPNKLGKLWNGLARLALHIEIPKSKDVAVNQYGDIQKIASKVNEALAEIKRISEGTLMSSGMGKEVSFECSCGSKNKRRIGLLKDGQIINCINPNCSESYNYIMSETSFRHRILKISCRACGVSHEVPTRKVENLKTDQNIHFDCDGCGETIYIMWRPMQTQHTELPTKSN